MNGKVWRGWAIGLGLALAAWAWGAGETVTFTFHPPDDGITLVQTRTQKKSETMGFGDDTETRVTVTVEKSRVKIVKTATGYTRTETQLSATKTVDGKTEEPDAFEKALLDMPVSVELDSKGTITVVHGIAAVREKTLAKMEDEERALFEKLMTPAHLEELLIADWVSDCKPVAGSTRKVGETWKCTTNEIVFSSKLMPVVGTYTLQGTDTLLDRPCAVLKAVAQPELKAAARDLRANFDELGILPGELKPKFTVYTHLTESTAYLDTALFLVLKAHSVEQVKYAVSAEGHEMQRTEKTESDISSDFETVWR